MFFVFVRWKGSILENVGNIIKNVDVCIRFIECLKVIFKKVRYVYIVVSNIYRYLGFCFLFVYLWILLY